MKGLRNGTSIATGLGLYPIRSRLDKDSYWCRVAGSSFVLPLCSIHCHNVYGWAVDLRPTSKSYLHLPAVWTMEIFATHFSWRNKWLKKHIRAGLSKTGAGAPWWGCQLLERSQQCLPSCAYFGVEKVNKSSYTLTLSTLSSSQLYSSCTLFSCVFQVVYECSASGQWINEEMGTELPKCVAGTTKICAYMHVVCEDHYFIHFFVPAPVFPPSSVHILKLFSALNLWQFWRYRKA